ncbi:MAG: EthD domain-containing protein [Sphingomonadales bacterium]|nr:EthD domain-containing protein [Sphingomonadales bacterium]PIX66993.1 MAG: ethyl tert-butyl ether degradation protein EthD [Sphingomonadales bacterium CG_4_10_14_3_um_filter_58_15]NCO50119.1 EthD domain-containing protein [Sphingomonadales bacterium]NCO99554.1 EthD domain-containing protein [Sphingomonadales bacterium]NCP27682.1 EthD domain-containing protein [Sphingomonadales bacterium]
MIKHFFLISKKPELSAEQFRAYYEANHVPLIKRLLPMFAHYQRHYIDRSESRIDAKQTDPDFDVITEIHFADQADYDAFLKTASDQDVLAQIRADEANFLISDATRSLRIDSSG